MAKLLLFPSFALMEKYETKEYRQQVINFLEEYKKTNKSVSKSNKHGFQTNDIDNKDICIPLFDHTVKLINKNYKAKPKVLFTLTNLWINENYKGSYNAPHCHPNSHFSGVFYVKTPKDCGNLTFHRETTSTMNELERFFDDPSNPSNGFDSFSIVAEEGKLIIFPANLLHSVTPNNSEESRISIAFNILVNYDK